MRNLIPLVEGIALDISGPLFHTMGDDQPGRKPIVSDQEILTIFEKSEDPVLMAEEVADELPIGRRAVYDRLRKLEDKGIIRSKKTGARSTVWWYPEHTQTNSTNP